MATVWQPHGSKIMLFIVFVSVWRRGPEARATKIDRMNHWAGVGQGFWASVVDEQFGCTCLIANHKEILGQLNKRINTDFANTQREGSRVEIYEKADLWGAIRSNLRKRVCYSCGGQEGAEKAGWAKSWCSNGIWSMIWRQMGRGTPPSKTIVASFTPCGQQTNERKKQFQ